MRLMSVFTVAVLAVLGFVVGTGEAQKAKEKKPKPPPPPWVAPALPNGKTVVTDSSDAFLKPLPNTLREGVTISKTAPKVDFFYLPGQTYKASIWSNWGDSLAINGKYYCAIGDHSAPEGNAYVYEYDPKTMVVRMIVNLRDLLQLMLGWYTPGKIHSRIDLGKDGMLYFSTHRGSTTTTTEKFHYTGDWIIRVDPKTAKAEIVAHGPVPKHCMPTSVLDPDRMIFYSGTAPGSKADGDIHFLAYDINKKKAIYAAENGPARTMIFARSTGRVYFVPKAETGQLVRFDPANPGTPTPINASMSLRAASEETKDGMVYCVGNTGKEKGTVFYSFNTKTEAVEELGPAAVASKEYIASVDVDPTGRYVYYAPGAHGGAQVDGTPVIQFDVKTRQRKVIAFLSPFFKEKYGADPVGTYATSIDPAGDKLYITWNVDRGVARHWDCCAVTVIHIPESERLP